MIETTSLASPSSGSDDEFRRGWHVLTAAVLGIGCGLSPIPFYTMGVFAPHLAQAFGWSTAQIMAGLTVTMAMVLWAGPTVGVLTERIGAYRVVIASQILFGLALMALALTNGSLLRFYATWALVAIGGAGTLPITWTGLVNARFDRHRGLALGLAMTGTGLFGILCKPYLYWVIGDYGWRAGYIALGLVPLLIALPAAAVLLRKPQSLQAHTRRADDTAGGLTVGETLRDWRFWLIAGAMIPIAFALAGPVPNLEAILTGDGLAPGRIVALTPLIGLSAIFGRLIGGWLLDRFWAPGVAFVILALPATGFVLLASGSLGFGAAAAAIVLLGFALGIEYDVIAYCAARYFGLRHYPPIYAMFYVCFAAGSGLAPMALGWDRERHGGFAHGLHIAAIVLVAGAALFLLLGRYRTFEPVKEPLAA